MTALTAATGRNVAWKRCLQTSLLLVLAWMFWSNHRMTLDWNTRHCEIRAADDATTAISRDKHANATTNNLRFPVGTEQMKESLEEYFHQATSTVSSTSSSASASNNNQNPLIRNIRMVMIGDSLMRYQYISLVYRLRHGVWFDDAQSSYTYHLVHDKSYANPFHNDTWGEFLFQTNRVLQPYEVCDCYRKPVKWIQDVIENRYYYDPILNNSVVFLLGFGHTHPMLGRLPAATALNQTTSWQRKAFQEFENTKGCCWTYRDWSMTIREYVQKLNPLPRHVVLNAGIWYHRFGSKLLQSTSSTTNSNTTKEEVVLTRQTTNLLQVMNETPQFHYTWRTTSCGKDRTCTSTEHDKIMCSYLHNCVNASYTQKVRQNLYCDDTHFNEPVYRSFNEELLDQLGYLPVGYQRMNLSDILE